MGETKKNKWQVMIDHRVEKVMRRLDNTLRNRLDQAIQGLAENPHPPNSRRLTGYKNSYRLRVGDWRVIYTIHQSKLVILVVKVESRGQVYKRK